MKDYFVYLAGGMWKFSKENFAEGNEWRIYCKDALERFDCDYMVRVINPNSYFNFLDDPPKYKSQSEIMRFDLNKLRNADLVVVNFNDAHSLGTQSEIAIAYERRIPVIGVDVNKQKLHPWQIAMCERIFDNMDDLIDYVEDFYLR